MKNAYDVKLMGACFRTVVTVLQNSSNQQVCCADAESACVYPLNVVTVWMQQVCMNGLKVVGAIMGKLPDFFSAVSETQFRQLIAYVFHLFSSFAHIITFVSAFV